jgi:hypothetical protein
MPPPPARNPKEKKKRDPPALLDEDGAVGELPARAEALVHLLQLERRRLVLGALGPREPRPGDNLPRQWRVRRGVAGPDGDLGLHLQRAGARARGGLPPLEAQRPLDDQLPGAQRPEQRRVPGAATGGRGGGLRLRRRLLQRVVVKGRAREQDAHLHSSPWIFLWQAPG